MTTIQPAGLADPIPLDERQRAQLAEVKARIDRGEAGYPDAYGLIHDWIKDDPRAQADGRDFWFEQARGINANDSLSAAFIRTHTEIGLDQTGVARMERLPMQELSNLIGQRVVQDVANSGEVLALPQMLARDIEVALDRGKLQLGGWGGSFYYWDQPYVRWNEGSRTFVGDQNPDGSVLTIGDQIDRLGQRELLVETSARTLVRMAELGQFDPSNDQHWKEAGLTSLDAGAPVEVKAAIATRAGQLGLERGAEVAEEIARAPLDRARENLMDRAGRALNEATEDVIDAAKGAVRRGVNDAVERLTDPLERLDPRADAARPALPAGFAPALEQPHDLRSPLHPGHAAFNEMQHRVAVFEAQHGIPRNPYSEQLAAGVLRVAVENGVHYQGVYFEKNAETGRIQMLDRSKSDVPYENARRFDLDLAKLSSQPIERSSQGVNEAVSKHYAEPARAQVQARTPEQAQALAGLSFDDQVMFGRLRRDVPGHIGDAHVLQAMAEAKRSDIPTAASVGGVMMLGDKIRVTGTGEGAPVASVDVTHAAPKPEASVNAIQSQNQQQALEQQMAQQQAQSQQQAAAIRMG